MCLIVACAWQFNLLMAQDEVPLAQENQELVLVITTKNRIISDGVVAHIFENEIYLPIIELADIFKITLEESRNDNVFEGYLISKERSFEIDTLNNLVVNGRKRIPFDKPLFFQPNSQGDDQIYILKSALETAWDIRANVALSALAIQVEQLKPLPAQVIADRRKNSLKALRKNGSLDDQNVEPFIATPYKTLGPPTINLQAREGFDSVDNALEGQVALSGVQEILGAKADYNLQFSHQNGTYQPPNNLRFRLTRENTYQGALPFDLEKVELGDVNIRNRDLIGRSLAGQGMTFTNKPKIQSNAAEPIDVLELGIPGHEVELYHNNALLDIGTVGQDGVYRYDDLELFYGQNTVKLFFYGPQGEVREVNKTYTINNDILRKGETQYAVAALFSENELFEISEDPENQPRGFASTIELAHGIGDRMSVFGTLNRVPTRSGIREAEDLYYMSAGLDIAAMNALSRFEIYNQANGGSAFKARSLTSIGDFKINMEAAFYNAFESTQAGIGSNKRDFEGELQIRRNFKTNLGHGGVNALLRRTHFESGTDATRATLRTFLNTPISRLTNAITGNFSSNGPTNMNGTFTNALRFDGNLLWRSGLNYTLRPEWDVTDMFSEFNVRHNQDYRTLLRGDYNFNTQEKRLLASVNRNFEHFTTGFETRWSSDHGLGFFIRSSTSFGPLADDNIFIADDDSLIATGPITANIYHDKNYNMIFDEGDEPIAGAHINVDGRNSKVQSSERGHLIYLNQAQRPVQVSLNNNSLKDPYMRSAHKSGFEVYARAATVQKLDFPVVETGAIDGTVLDPNDKSPIKDLDIFLVETETGKIIQETKTGFDGYYTFEFVFPGTYRIQTSAYGKLGYFQKDITLDREELFQFGVDLATTDLRNDNIVTLLMRTESVLSQMVGD